MMDFRLLETDGPRPDKPVLCLDFDGVLHSYKSGWRKAYFIPDPPVPGAMRFLIEAVKHFTVVVYSSRSHQDGGIPAMCAWIDHWLDEETGDNIDLLPEANGVRNNLMFAQHKPSAMVSIDDRALTFTGTWPKVEELLKFKPWNKK